MTRVRVGVECGQRLWRPRSWRHKPRLRRLPGGFAVGPLMVWKEPVGCDCTTLCSMGPTCPGGILARLPGAGCARSGGEAAR